MHSLECLVGPYCYLFQTKVLSFYATSNYEISNIVFPFLGPILGISGQLFQLLFGKTSLWNVMEIWLFISLKAVFWVEIPAR